MLYIQKYLIWNYLLHDYQRQRVLTFINPETDPLGAGYHIIQSTIAIGSGGLYGKGWLNGTQSHLDFLPERSTDFIFAVFAEEFGFMGILLLLAIYSTIIVRGLIIANQAQDTFTRLLAGSLTLTFFVYIFVNIGMWLERFVIVVTSLHRDFLPSSWDMFIPNLWDWMTYIGTLGLFFTLLFLFMRVLPMIAGFEVKELFHHMKHHDKGKKHP